MNGLLGRYVTNLAILENHGDIVNAIHQSLNLVDWTAMVIVERITLATLTDASLLKFSLL